MPSHQSTSSACSSPASTVSMDPSSPDGNIHRSGRQRLRPWLEAQVNSGKHPGLEWVDRERRIFRITWKHGGRADWSEEDGSIFKAWAVHTGRFREGVDEPDWPTWKTRLRCAINKQKPDIQELKDMSCSEEPRPYRVFQFFTRKESGSNSPPQVDIPELAPDKDDGFRYPVQDRPSVIQANNGNIPTIINESLDMKPCIDRPEECVEAQVNSLGSDLQHVSINDLVPPSGISLTNISVDSNINSYTEAMDTDSLKEPGGQLPMYQQIKLEPQENTDPLYSEASASVTDHEMLVTLRFRNEIVFQEKVTNPHGCRVFYGDVPYEGVWDSQVFGSREAAQIVVPYNPGQLRSVQQDQFTQEVLNGLELGISIAMDKRNIYVERRCKTRIITAPANLKGKETQRLERREKKKVFDFTQDFLEAFRQYQQGEGPRPSPQVIIGVGQNFHTDVEPYANLFFSVTVCHLQASDLLSQYTVSTSRPEMSHSDQYDHHMTALKRTQATIPFTTITQDVIPEPVYQDNLPMM